MTKEKNIRLNIILLSIFAFIFFYSAFSQDIKIQQQNINNSDSIISNLLFYWSNEYLVNEDLEKFSLQFLLEENKLIAIYSNNGPFEQILKCKIISENQVDLYFDYLIGSTSFIKSTKSKKNKCKNKIASCYIENATLQVQTFEDKCGYIPKNKKFILKISN